MDEMVDSLCRELELRQDYLKEFSIETIYLGGGTPSLLSEPQLSKLFTELRRLYPYDWKEVTLEANPDDLSEKKLQLWKSLGVDRLSLGIQSFQEQILSFYNRAHTAQEAKSAIHKARKAGFSKFTLDLIYGFPNPDHRLWHQDLEQALELDPGHISAYALTVEPRTALGNWTKKGKFEPADDDFVAEQFEWMQAALDQAGYLQYEVSNFGKPGQFGLHNRNYWKGLPYLGIGPSAHSYDGKSRGYNPSSNPQYIKAIQSGEIPFIIEDLNPSESVNEQILTGLRTIWGVAPGEILEKWGIDLIQAKAKEIELMKGKGWLNWDGNTLSLSSSGLLLADSIAAELFI